MSAKEMMQTEWTPQPYLVYKPSPRGDGTAMRLQLRLEPEWKAVGEAGTLVPVIKGNGGCFLELAAQQGFGEGGYAAFGWGDAKLLRAKLGLADVLKLRSAIQDVRVANREVAASSRGKDGAPYVVSLFHKFNSGSTVISYSFEETRSLVRVSKAKDWARTISLEPHEEYGFGRYLDLALEGFLRVGLR